ncbi:methionyl-tRNA formyltransferase [Magnetococcales bacterium HHB-1]
MEKKLNIVFMGTPDFASTALKALLKSVHKVLAVFTQPDKPSGRGLRKRQSPVKQLAMKHDLSVFQPSRLRGDTTSQEALQSLKPDLIVVAAYGQILPKEILELPPLGCINIHASLLPRWRGAAPIHRALMAGDSQTGITIMQMDEGLDTGDMLKKRALPITEESTGGSLHDQLALLGGALLVETLDNLMQIKLKPQPEEGITYANKLENHEKKIPWQKSAQEVQRLIRAFNPWPVAMTHLEGKDFKIHQAYVGENTVKAEPGVILGVVDFKGEVGLEVACGEGSLVITELQPAGKRKMAVADWLRGLKGVEEMVFC